MSLNGVCQKCGKEKEYDENAHCDNCPVKTDLEEFLEKAHNKIVEDHLKIEEIEHGENNND